MIGERLGSPEAIGVGLTILTATAYAWIDVTAKLAYRGGLSVETLLSFRFLGAGSLLLLLSRSLRLGSFPSRAMVGRLLGLGVVGYGLGSFLLNLSLHRMAVGPVILIFFTYPSMIAIVALVLGRDRMSSFKLVALALSVLGLVLVLSFPTRGMNLPGVLLALGAALAFACYVLTAERTMGRMHNVVFSGFVLVGAGVAIAVIGFGSGTIHMGLGAASWGWALLHLLLISVAVVSLTGAITMLGATRAAIGNTLEPALAVVLATIVLGERMVPQQLAGGVLLVIAISLLPLAGVKARADRAELV